MKINSLDQLKQVLEEGKYIYVSKMYLFWSTGGVCRGLCCDWEFDDINECIETVMFMADEDFNNLEVGDE